MEIILKACGYALLVICPFLVLLLNFWSSVFVLISASVILYYEIKTKYFSQGFDAFWRKIKVGDLPL